MPAPEAAELGRGRAAGRYMMLSKSFQGADVRSRTSDRWGSAVVAAPWTQFPEKQKVARTRRKVPRDVGTRK